MLCLPGMTARAMRPAMRPMRMKAELSRALFLLRLVDTAGGAVSRVRRHDASAHPNRDAPPTAGGPKRDMRARGQIGKRFPGFCGTMNGCRPHAPPRRDRPHRDLRRRRHRPLRVRPGRRDSKGPKPFLHPVRALDGAPLTAFRPWDHRWHKGLQMTWTHVSGQNFWGGNTYRARTRRLRAARQRRPHAPRRLHGDDGSRGPTCRSPKS